jgi:hypothetical protein
MIEALQDGACRDWAAAVTLVCERAQRLFDCFECLNLLIDVDNLCCGPRADIGSDRSGSRP